MTTADPSKSDTDTDTDTDTAAQRLDHDSGFDVELAPADVIADPDRLAAIRQLGLHGQLGDRNLDAIVATVAAGCHAPLAVVNVVTPDRQTYPAETGVGAAFTEVPDGLSFCAEVVRTGRPLVVADASAHDVYKANPLVQAGVVGAYAGEPLMHRGHVIGALSMFDRAAREFTRPELDVLHAQARLAMAAVRLRDLGSRDPLTGLNNRAQFLERTARALRKRTGEQIVALLTLDVVGMGRLNARMGTPAGDLILRAVAEHLRKASRVRDCAARIGGDEFALLLVVDSVEEAQTRADAACEAVTGPFLVQGRPVTLKVRRGLTTSFATSADELLGEAERAAVAEPAKTGPSGSSRVDELSRAMDGGELVLHYQPVVDFGTGEVTGAEALVRWQHPQRGLLMPADVIPLAEESGLIVPLGDWVLRTGATQAAEWAARGQPLDVAINLSPLQMAARGFADHVIAMLEAVGAPLDLLMLEVTESALLDQPQAEQSLTDLRRAGVRLALDDFGTGYSSFAYLRRFPIDLLKIDRSFVAGLGQHPDDDAIVASVVGLARSTGKSVIAEGVETHAQLAQLEALGVQAGQGYLWTGALPAALLEEWIRQAKPVGTAFWQQERIRQMYAEGASVHTIAASLNARGSRSPAGRRWHARSVALALAPAALPTPGYGR